MLKPRLLTRWFLLGMLLLLAFPATVLAAPPVFPSVIPLPNGWQPEGIAVGRGANFYVGSIPTGAIYHGDLRTGAGEVLVQPVEGRAAVGLDYDSRSNALFVAGGPTGEAYVYNASTGDLLQEYTLTTEAATFINDVYVTRSAAYFTDSLQPVLYKIPLGPAGRLPGPGAVEAIPLSGDFTMLPGLNANGIVATPSGDRLIVNNLSAGTLYLVDPQTGAADLIPLEGGDVLNADGMVLIGKTLYVVQNANNQIAVIQLNPQYQSGVITGYLTDPNLMVPSTIAAFGKYIYAVNARFDVPTPTPDTEYSVVQLRRAH